uniref:Uncharacterized protein n=1 Tax=Oryza brachyantha TaxID=4533 RepID=J3L3R3_ORYBR
MNYRPPPRPEELQPREKDSTAIHKTSGDCMRPQRSRMRVKEGAAAPVAVAGGEQLWLRGAHGHVSGSVRCSPLPMPHPSE